MRSRFLGNNKGNSSSSNETRHVSFVNNHGTSKENHLQPPAKRNYSYRVATNQSSNNIPLQGSKPGQYNVVGPRVTSAMSGEQTLKSYNYHASDFSHALDFITLIRESLKKGDKDLERILDKRYDSLGTLERSAMRNIFAEKGKCKTYALWENITTIRQLIPNIRSKHKNNESAVNELKKQINETRSGILKLLVSKQAVQQKEIDKFEEEIGVIRLKFTKCWHDCFAESSVVWNRDDNKVSKVTSTGQVPSPDYYGKFTHQLSVKNRSLTEITKENKDILHRVDKEVEFLKQELAKPIRKPRFPTRQPSEENSSSTKHGKANEGIQKNRVSEKVVVSSGVLSKPIPRTVSRPDNIAKQEESPGKDFDKRLSEVLVTTVNRQDANGVNLTQTIGVWARDNNKIPKATTSTGQVPNPDYYEASPGKSNSAVQRDCKDSIILSGKGGEHRKKPSRVTTGEFVSHTQASQRLYSAPICIELSKVHSDVATSEHNAAKDFSERFSPPLCSSPRPNSHSRMQQCQDSIDSSQGSKVKHGKANEGIQKNRVSEKVVVSSGVLSKPIPRTVSRPDNIAKQEESPGKDFDKRLSEVLVTTVNRQDANGVNLTQTIGVWARDNNKIPKATTSTGQVPNPDYYEASPGKSNSAVQRDYKNNISSDKVVVRAKLLGSSSPTEVATKESDRSKCRGQDINTMNRQDANRDNYDKKTKVQNGSQIRLSENVINSQNTQPQSVFQAKKTSNINKQNSHDAKSMRVMGSVRRNSYEIATRNADEVRSPAQDSQRSNSAPIPYERHRVQPDFTISEHAAYKDFFSVRSFSPKSSSSPIPRKVSRPDDITKQEENTGKDFDSNLNKLINPDYYEASPGKSIGDVQSDCKDNIILSGKGGEHSGKPSRFTNDEGNRILHPGKDINSEHSQDANGVNLTQQIGVRSRCIAHSADKQAPHTHSDQGLVRPRLLGSSNPTEMINQEEYYLQSKHNIIFGCIKESLRGLSTEVQLLNSDISKLRAKVNNVIEGLPTTGEESYYKSLCELGKVCYEIEEDHVKQLETRIKGLEDTLKMKELVSNIKAKNPRLTYTDYLNKELGEIVEYIDNISKIIITLDSTIDEILVQQSNIKKRYIELGMVLNELDCQIDGILAQQVESQAETLNSQLNDASQDEISFIQLENSDNAQNHSIQISGYDCNVYEGNHEATVVYLNNITNTKTEFCVQSEKDNSSYDSSSGYSSDVSGDIAQLNGSNAQEDMGQDSVCDTLSEFENELDKSKVEYYESEEDYGECSNCFDHSICSVKFNDNFVGKQRDANTSESSSGYSSNESGSKGSDSDTLRDVSTNTKTELGAQSEKDDCDSSYISNNTSEPSSGYSSNESDSNVSNIDTQQYGSSTGSCAQQVPTHVKDTRVCNYGINAERDQSEQDNHYSLSCGKKEYMYQGVSDYNKSHLKEAKPSAVLHGANAEGLGHRVYTLMLETSV